MTNAAAFQHSYARPSRLDRAVLALGLALVSWSQNSTSKRSYAAQLTREDAAVLRAARADSVRRRAGFEAARWQGTSHWS